MTIITFTNEKQNLISDFLKAHCGGRKWYQVKAKKQEQAEEYADGIIAKNAAIIAEKEAAEMARQKRLAMPSERHYEGVDMTHIRQVKTESSVVVFSSIFSGLDVEIFSWNLAFAITTLAINIAKRKTGIRLDGVLRDKETHDAIDVMRNDVMGEVKSVLKDKHDEIFLLQTAKILYQSYTAFEWHLNGESISKRLKGASVKKAYYMARRAIRFMDDDGVHNTWTDFVMWVATYPQKCTKETADEFIKEMLANGGNVIMNEIHNIKH